MSYSPTNWIDRAVEEPRRFTDQDSNVLVLTPSPGAVTEEGTDFSATNMNKIEEGIQKNSYFARSFMLMGG
jgi:tetrahydromethanopterin S-methyltransferase subunit B